MQIPKSTGVRPENFQEPAAPSGPKFLEAYSTEDVQIFETRGAVACHLQGLASARWLYVDVEVESTAAAAESTAAP